MTAVYVQRVLGRLGAVRECSDGWMALCPAHQDSTPSLHVSVGEKGKILLKCFAGCDVWQVLAAAELGVKQMFPVSGEAPAPTTATTEPGQGGEGVNFRHQVYTAFLHHLKLSPEGGLALANRGIHDHRGYRTLDTLSVSRAVRKLYEELGDALITVPGFVPNTSGFGCPVKAAVTDGLAIPVRDVWGKIQGLQVRSPDGETPKYKWFSGRGQNVGSSAHVSTSGLTPCESMMETVVLTEGPLKADVIRSLMQQEHYKKQDNGWGQCPVVGIPGVSTWKSALPALQGTKTVYLAFDMDWVRNAGVRKAWKECVWNLARRNIQLNLVVWSTDHKGFDDLLNAGGIWRVVKGEGDVGEVLNREYSEHTNAEGGPPEILVRAALEYADQMKPEPVEWLWEPWIAYGALNLLDGDPGLGKSLISTDIAAMSTLGRDMGSGKLSLPPIPVLFLSAEDDPARTIVPRLEAAEADLERVQILRGFFQDDGKRNLVTFPANFDELEQLVRVKGYKLIVVDPLMAYLDSTINGFRDQDVRLVLSRLADIAQETQAAVLMVRHLNKLAGGAALYRGGGSIGIVGAARVAMVVGKDSTDPDLRVLTQSKNNLAPLPRGMTYRIAGNPPRIVWEGETNVSADDLLRSPRGEERERDKGKLEEAIHLLTTELSSGPKPKVYMLKKATVRGFSDNTLTRARGILRIEAFQRGGEWYMQLPGPKVEDARERGEEE